MTHTYHIFDFYTRKHFFRRTTGLLRLSQGELKFHTFDTTLQIGTPEKTSFKLRKNNLIFFNKETRKSIAFLRTGGTMYRLPQEKNNKLIALLPSADIEAEYLATIQLIKEHFGEYAEAMFMDGKHNAEMFAFLLRESGFKQS